MSKIERFKIGHNKITILILMQSQWHCYFTRNLNFHPYLKFVAKTVLTSIMTVLICSAKICSLMFGFKIGQFSQTDLKIVILLDVIFEFEPFLIYTWYQTSTRKNVVLFLWENIVTKTIWQRSTITKVCFCIAINTGHRLLKIYLIIILFSQVK